MTHDLKSLLMPEYPHDHACIIMWQLYAEVYAV